jgi:hypothetical protein
MGRKGKEAIWRETGWGGREEKRQAAPAFIKNFFDRPKEMFLKLHSVASLLIAYLVGFSEVGNAPT